MQTAHKVPIFKKIKPQKYMQTHTSLCAGVYLYMQ